MQLKSKAEVQAAVNAAYGVQGFSAAADPTDAVMACCAGASAETEAAVAAYAASGEVGAVPFLLIIQLALQLAPILFGPGGLTIEKVQAALQLILSIFVPAP